MRRDCLRVWELEGAAGAWEWEPMPLGLLLGTDEAATRRQHGAGEPGAAADGGGGGDDVERAGQYQLDLGRLTQTSLETRTVRRIRPGRRPRSEALEGARGGLGLELARPDQPRDADGAADPSGPAAAERGAGGGARPAGPGARAAAASQEALRLGAEGRLAGAEAALRASEEKGRELERQVAELREALRLSREREAAWEASSTAAANDPPPARDTPGLGSDEARERESSSARPDRESAAVTRRLGPRRAREREEALGQRLEAARAARRERRLAAAVEELAAAARRHDEQSGLARGEIARLSEGLARAEREADTARQALAAAQAEARALAAQCRAAGFQAVARLLAQVRRPGGAARTLVCPAEAPAAGGPGRLSRAGLLGCFRAHVAEAFLGTREAQPAPLGGAGPGPFPAPEFEILEVKAAVNPVLAERFCHAAEQLRAGEPSWGHALTALRVARPPDAMRLLGLSAAAGGGEAGGGIWDEAVLLGWHGARDGAVAEILADGFNPCCAGDDGLFGRGIYFAENSSKADRYAGPGGARGGRRGGARTVMLSAVLCGNMHAARAAMRGGTRPPAPAAEQTAATGIRG